MDCLTKQVYKESLDVWRSGPPLCFGTSQQVEYKFVRLREAEG